MNEIKLIEKLSKLEKPIFTLADLQKILPVSSHSLYTTISRLTKRGVLQKISRGVYAPFGKIVIPEEVAPLLYYPSYLSLNTVLSKVGVINQIPQEVLLVTPRKTKTLKISGTKVVYRQIQKKLFFGWHLLKGIPTAYPEKALLDLIYFASRGRAYLPLRELDLSSLDPVRWQKFAPLFPKTTQRLISRVTKKLRL